MDRFTLTRRLVPHLLVNYSNHSSCSLMSGKMGGALFFSLYARSSGIAYYDEYSDDLIDDVYNHLNK